MQDKRVNVWPEFGEQTYLCLLFLGQRRTEMDQEELASDNSQSNGLILDSADRLHRWWIASDLLEAATVHNPDMMAVANPDNSARGQSPKGSADRRGRDADVFTNVCAVHRQVDVSHRLALGDLELFKQLQKHRKLGSGASLTEQKCMSLCLAQLLAQFAHNMELQLRVLGKAAS